MQSPLYLYIRHLTSYIGKGPWPMQLVVVTAVSAAVRAATMTFATTSQKRLLFMSYKV